MSEGNNFTELIMHTNYIDTSMDIESNPDEVAFEYAHITGATIAGYLHNAEMDQLITNEEAARWYKVLLTTAIKKSWKFGQIRKETDKCIRMIRRDSAEAKALVKAKLEQLEDVKLITEQSDEEKKAAKEENVGVDEGSEKLALLAEHKNVDQQPTRSEENDSGNDKELVARAEKDGNTLSAGNKRNFDQTRGLDSDDSVPVVEKKSCIDRVD